MSLHGHVHALLPSEHHAEHSEAHLGDEATIRQVSCGLVQVAPTDLPGGSWVLEEDTVLRFLTGAAAKGQGEMLHEPSSPVEGVIGVVGCE